MQRHSVEKKKARGRALKLSNDSHSWMYTVQSRKEESPWQGIETAKYNPLTDTGVFVEKKKARGRALKQGIRNCNNVSIVFVEKKKARGRALKLPPVSLFVSAAQRRKEESPWQGIETH